MKHLLPLYSILIFLGFACCTPVIAQTITTIAGNGTASYGGDGGAATAAELNHPFGIAIDRAGNYYIAEEGNSVVRKVSASGNITTVAGTGTSGYSGDSGPATAAELSSAYSVALDTNGNLFIADYGNNVVRKVDTAGIITTFAGGSAGTSLAFPSGVVTDMAGNIYISDAQYSLIRKVTPSGTMTNIAGTGGPGFSGDGGAATAASVSHPWGIAIDTFGNIYIADYSNYRIRKINTAGIITTIAGNGTSGYSGDGGPATAAELNSPVGVAADKLGNVYIADLYDNRIRKVSPAGIISTLTGNGTASFGGDGGTASAGLLKNPYGLAVDNCGNVYIADGNNHRVRYVDAGTYALAGTISGRDSTCTGDTLALHSTVSGGAWSSHDTAIASVNTTGVVTGISAGATEITYTVTTPCGVAIAKRQVHINTTAPTGTITGFSPLCVGYAVTLHDSAGAIGGTWSTSSRTVASVTAAGLVTAIGAGIDTIRYTVTNGCGPASASLIFTVYPRPLAGTITGPVGVCEGGATITLSDTTAAFAGTWTSGTSSVATIDSTTGLVTGIVPGTTVITYTVSNSCGSTAATYTINVYPLPHAGVITGVAVVCHGATTILDDTATGGVWSMTNGRATISATGSVFGISRGLDTVVYRSTTLCGSVSVIFPMTIDSLPVSGTISATSPICDSTTTRVASSVAGGTWSLTDTSIGVLSGTTFVARAPGSDTVLYSMVNHCGTATSRFPLTVLPILLPAVGVHAAPGDTVCAGQSVVYTAVPVTGGASPGVQWFKFGLPIGSGPSYTYTPINGDIISCAMESNYQCPARDTVYSSPLTMLVNSLVTPNDSIASSLSGDTVTYLGQIATCYSNTTYCGSTPTYQWYMNRVAQPGATSSAFATSVYHNDTIYCIIHCSGPCATRTSDTSNIIILKADYLTTGLASLESGSSSINLYPNPSNGALELAGTCSGTPDGPVSYEIFDITGRMIASQAIEVQNSRFNTHIALPADLPDGQYLIRVFGQGVNKVLTFINRR